MKTNVKLNGKKILLLVAVAFIATILAVLSVPTQAIEAEAAVAPPPPTTTPVDYLKEDGQIGSMDCYPLESSTTGTLISGDAYVKEDVSISGIFILSSNTNIILQDETTLTIVCGSNVINLNGYSLTIYAQTNDLSKAGSLIVKGGCAVGGAGNVGIQNGSFTVVGGNIKISGGDASANDKPGGVALNLGTGNTFTYKGGSCIFSAGKNGESYLDSVKVNKDTTMDIQGTNKVYYGENLDGSECFRYSGSMDYSKDLSYMAINPDCVKTVSTTNPNRGKTYDIYYDGMSIGAGTIMSSNGKEILLLHNETGSTTMYMVSKTSVGYVENDYSNPILWDYSDGVLSHTFETTEKYLFFFTRKVKTTYYLTANERGKVSLSTAKPIASYRTYTIKSNHEPQLNECDNCGEAIVDSGVITDVKVIASKLKKKVLFFNVTSGYKYNVNVMPGSHVQSIAISYDNKKQAHSEWSDSFFAFESTKKTFYIWVTNDQGEKLVYLYKNGKITKIS